MKFGQALEALLSGNLVTCPELNRSGALLGIQAPAGAITQPFIYLQLGNGERMPWTPDQPAIFSTGWNVVAQEKQAEQREREHAGAVRG